MDHIIEYLKEQTIELDIEFYSEDFLKEKILNLVNENDFNSMLSYFQENEPFPNLIPLLTDNNSNYICIFGDGLLKGKVMILNHSEPILSPKFKNSANFINYMYNNPEKDVFYEWNLTDLDYPIKEKDKLTQKDEMDLKYLWEKFNKEKNDYNRTQFAYCICDLTPFERISELKLFLDDEDFYIQEYAIKVFTTLNYKPPPTNN